MNQSDYVQPVYPSHDNGHREANRHRGQAARRSRLHEPTHFVAECESTGTFLQPEEIRSLTDRTRRHAQAKALLSMGIEHKVRPDGGIAVLRSHITKVFDGSSEANLRKQQKAASPNWLAV